MSEKAPEEARRAWEAAVHAIAQEWATASSSAHSRGQDPPWLDGAKDLELQAQVGRAIKAGDPGEARKAIAAWEMAWSRVLKGETAPEANSLEPNGAGPREGDPTKESRKCTGQALADVDKAEPLNIQCDVNNMEEGMDTRKYLRQSHRYLKVADVVEPMNLVITGTEHRTFDNGDKLALIFKGEDRLWVNQTNLKFLHKRFGYDDEGWKGRSVGLCVDAGGTFPGLGPFLRLREPDAARPVKPVSKDSQEPRDIEQELEEDTRAWMGET
jgi:hypothetical protein